MGWAEEGARRRLLMLTRQAFLRTSAATALAVPLSACASGAGSQHVTIINTGAADSYVMQTLAANYYGKFGLDATTVNVSDGIKLLAAVISGSADIAMITGFSQIFPAIAQGAGIKLVAGGMLMPDNAMYCGNPLVHSLKDLEGRSVGTGSVGALTHIMTVAMLRRAGVDIAKVRFVNIGSSSDVFKAIVAGKVDAGSAQHDYLLDAKRAGIRVIAEGNELIPDFMQQAAFASDRAIATKRDGLVRTLATYASVYRFVQNPKNEDTYAQAYATAGGTLERGRVKFEWLQKHDVYATNLQLPQSSIWFEQELNVVLGIQQRVLSYNDVVDLSLAHDALKLLG
jgi:ABC-type nitrate/sulfonate/bicarbonate transport system substrate-binding protein